jgi:hypothetical protein
MKKIFLLLIIISTFSCKNSSENSSQIEIEKEYLGIEDISNSETKYETIITENATDNFKLLNILKSKLKKANFNFTEQKEIRKMSYNNCEENIIININGNGIRQYFIRSKKARKAYKRYIC